jgi:3-oxoacyl-[acyl-carrier protein] reductase
MSDLSTLPVVSDEEFRLEGKTALITAAASGMGRAAALLFAARGAHVIIADINGQGATNVVSEIERRGGGSAEAHGIDLADPVAVEPFFETLFATHDVVDVLYNQVGLTGPTYLDYDLASWTELMTVNLWVPMMMTKRVLPLLRQSRAGSIIFTSSTAGLTAVPPLPTYAASKAGVIQFMKSVALMLAGEGIRANAICPGGTDTASMRRDINLGIVQTTVEELGRSVPIGRIGEPEDMARVALFLASDASRYMTGVVIPVDGGATLGANR